MITLIFLYHQLIYLQTQGQTLINKNMFNLKTKTFDIGDGRQITIETGKLARQADGSALVRMGKCAILATVVANKEPKPGQSFFPLSVDYQEKFAAAGRIPGSFLQA
jgi:polyribonucleotide nucleotidyltransferase